jgi:hypothetical protein
MAERCFWCNTDPDEAAARFEGPHATWCLHYSHSPAMTYRKLVGQVYRELGWPIPNWDAQPDEEDDGDAVRVTSDNTRAGD